MTKELAIRVLTGDVLGTTEQTQEAVKIAVKALLKTSGKDPIEREAVVDILHNAMQGRSESEENLIGDIVSEVDLLPPAQPEQRWIPCSERLPDKTDDYLCSYSGCAVVDICEYDPDRNEWGFFYDGGWKVVSNVTAWMPLPEPYKEKDNERA